MKLNFLMSFLFTYRCLQISDICDGAKNCASGQDEINCGNFSHEFESVRQVWLTRELLQSERNTWLMANLHRHDKSTRILSLQIYLRSLWVFVNLQQFRSWMVMFYSCLASVPSFAAKKTNSSVLASSTTFNQISVGSWMPSSLGGWPSRPFAVSG